jgi:hypothetical protein
MLPSEIGGNAAIRGGTKNIFANTIDENAYNMIL